MGNESVGRIMKEGGELTRKLLACDVRPVKLDRAEYMVNWPGVSVGLRQTSGLACGVRMLTKGSGVEAV
jgi:hypothetical protein